MRYCPVCILPDTRPNIRFDGAGYCNCATIEKKRTVDWAKRESALKHLLAGIKGRGRRYDCVIPVSGGKDSTWQVIKALEYGLKPLCVTWRTPARNDLGRANLNNLIRLGVDHFDVSINPHIERVFTFKAFERNGSPALPMHMAIFAIPMDAAIRYEVPLVLWGENSAFEYGGDDPETLGTDLNRAWLLRYGTTNGTTVDDWIEDDLPARDMAIYYWPTDAELRGSGIRAIFLGQYVQWDPVKTYEIASAHGFVAHSGRPKTGFYEFADIDDDFIVTIHHWLKWYKFGFTRLWDNLSIEIRNGRMTRSQAVDVVRHHGEEKPDREIDLFCEYTRITRRRFFEISDRFRNPNIWKLRGNSWQIDDFLIKDWAWR
jgi:N-acetyl sugar amidotransferase